MKSQLTTRTPRRVRLVAMALGATMLLSACGTGSNESISMSEDGAFDAGAMIVQAANPLFRQPVPTN